MRAMKRPQWALAMALALVGCQFSPFDPKTQTGAVASPAVAAPQALASALPQGEQSVRIAPMVVTPMLNGAPVEAGRIAVRSLVTGQYLRLYVPTADALDANGSIPLDEGQEALFFEGGSAEFFLVNPPDGPTVTEVQPAAPSGAARRLQGVTGSLAARFALDGRKIDSLSIRIRTTSNTKVFTGKVDNPSPPTQPTGRPSSSSQPSPTPSPSLVQQQATKNQSSPSEVTTVTAKTFEQKAAAILSRSGSLSEENLKTLEDQVNALSKAVEEAAKDPEKKKQIDAFLSQDLSKQTPAQRETVLNSLSSQLGLREQVQALEKKVDEVATSLPAPSQSSDPNAAPSTSSSGPAPQASGQTPPTSSDDANAQATTEPAKLVCGASSEPVLSDGNANFKPTLSLSYGSGPSLSYRLLASPVGLNLSVTESTAAGTPDVGQIVARISKADGTFTKPSSPTTNLLSLGTTNTKGSTARTLTIKESDADATDRATNVQLSGELGSEDLKGNSSEMVYVGQLRTPSNRVATVQVFDHAGYYYLAMTFSASSSAVDSQGGTTTMQVSQSFFNLTRTTNVNIEVTSRAGTGASYCRTLTKPSSVL